MVLDSLKNADAYAGLGKNIADGFAWLKKTDLAALPVGKTVIDGTRLYASVQEYTTKPESEGRWEAHRKYIDIQFIVAGRETMGVTPVKGLEVQEAYNADNDVLFGKGTLADGMALHVEAGEFAIFYPQDAHAPMLQWKGPTKVNKIVVKVAVE